MKQNFVLKNFVLSLAVLFSILFPAIHSYNHLLEQFEKKECFHKSISNHEITHKHKTIETCLVCNLKIDIFSSFLISKIEFQNFIFIPLLVINKIKDNIDFFQGSLFGLRAPPVFMS